MISGLLLLLGTLACAQTVVQPVVAPVPLRVNFAPVMPVAPTQPGQSLLAPQLNPALSLTPSVLPVSPQLQALQPSLQPAAAPQAPALEGRPLRLIILGPPGSGKGTYSQKLVEETGIVHISAGELLREYAKTHPELAEIMKQGKLVPTETLLGLLRERLSQDDVRQKGFILDGSPRRMEEAPVVESMLDELGLKPDAIVRLEVSEAELKRRILARGRMDDSESVFAERMRVYREQTMPVYDYFQGKVPFVTPSVEGSDADENYSNVRTALEKLVRRKAAADAGAASTLFKSLSDASRQGSGAALHASIYDAAGRAAELGRTPARADAAAVPASPAIFQAKNPKDAAWAQEVLEKARLSPAGRRVLDEADRIFARRGPIPLEVKKLGRNLAELDYMKGVIRVSPKVRRGDLGNAAATLVHELLHVLQHAQGIPSEALEMELEAHLVTLEVLRDLGVPLEADPFSKEAHRRLLRGTQDYVDWLGGQLPSKGRLLGSSMEQFLDELEYDADEASERIEKLEDRLEAEPGNARLKARLEHERSVLEWIERDRELLGTPEGRRRYEDFAQRVRGLLEGYHARRGRPI